MSAKRLYCILHYISSGQRVKRLCFTWFPVTLGQGGAAIRSAVRVRLLLPCSDAISQLLLLCGEAQKEQNERTLSNIQPVEGWLEIERERELIYFNLSLVCHFGEKYWLNNYCIVLYYFS